jgi:LPS O-antigen subunit length determinant protein (WzzB/FepE family)
MENTIRNLSSLKECFDKVSVNDALSFSDKDLKTTCLKERINFVESINNLKMTDMIKERLEIKKVKEHERAEKRREYLDRVFK